MQQLLSAFGIDWRLLAAQAVNFAIVIIALWYFLYKPVLAMLAKRQEMIAKGVEDAEKAEKLFASADSEAESRVKAADTEAEKIVALARESAQAEKARLLKEADERAAVVAKDAEARAAEATARAQRESEKEVARLSVLAAEKILKEHYDR
jgi:F-type H+-transporting ATPase subunit b